MGRLRLDPRLALWLLFLPASTAFAQFEQYTAPGELSERTRDRKEDLDRAVEEARWRLGPVRVQPVLGLQDMGYEDSSFGSGSRSEADFTATFAAGLDAYLRTGPAVTWEAHAVPAYVWWSDQSDRNRTNGRYSAGFFGDFNRVTLEITAGRDDSQGIPTPEYERRATTRQERAEAALAVRLGAFDVFGSLSELEQSHLVDDLDDPRGRAIASLDREERVGRAGVRYRPRGWLGLAVGAEASRVDFPAGAADRSNSGTSPFVELELDGNRLYALAAVTLRSLDPQPGSRFVPFEGETGRLLVSLFPEGRLTPHLYAGRGLVYAVDADYAYFEDDRFGAGLGYRPAESFLVAAFAESGRLDYTSASAAVPGRRDDFTTVGARLQWRLGRVELSVRMSRADYDSNLPAFDRTVTSIETGLRLSGGLVWE